MKVFKGSYKADYHRYAIVVSRWNEEVTENLLKGAIECLTRHGVDAEDITVAWVPGAFEIPRVAQEMANSAKYDAVICLGAIIRGATDHYEYVASQAAAGIAQANMESEAPILFGVLTTENIEQALERSGLKSGNKGFETALAAIEMVNLSEDLLLELYEDELSEILQEFKNGEESDESIDSELQVED